MVGLHLSLTTDGDWRPITVKSNVHYCIYRKEFQKVIFCSSILNHNINLNKALCPSLTVRWELVWRFTERRRWVSLYLKLVMNSSVVNWVFKPISSAAFERTANHFSTVMSLFSNSLLFSSSDAATSVDQTTNIMLAFQLFLKTSCQNKVATNISIINISVKVASFCHSGRQVQPEFHVWKGF